MMELYRINKPVKPILNKSGQVVDGVWDIEAVPLSNSHLAQRAVPTYENVANLDAGVKSKPEEGTTFLGEVVNNVLYIVKFLDVHPKHAAEGTSVPAFKAIATNQDPGDWTVKSPAFNFISVLRNGVIKLVSGMGSFIFMDPYIPGRGILELLDRLVLTFKNFIFNLYGGSIMWTNFKEEEKWKSELAVDIYRGKSTDRNEDDKIKARMGSLTEDKTHIFDVDINHTTEDNKVFNLHQKFGDDGLTKEIEADKVTVTETTKPDSLQTIVKTEKVEFTDSINPDSLQTLIKTENVTVQKDTTSNMQKVTIDANGHELTITINSSGLIVSSNKRITFNVDNAVTIDTKNATVKAENITVNGSSNITFKGGGTLSMKGTPVQKVGGPLNFMPICPFTGAPHGADTVTGVGSG